MTRHFQLLHRTCMSEAVSSPASAIRVTCATSAEVHQSVRMLRMAAFHECRTKGVCTRTWSHMLKHTIAMEGNKIPMIVRERAVSQHEHGGGRTCCRRATMEARCSFHHRRCIGEKHTATHMVLGSSRRIATCRTTVADECARSRRPERKFGKHLVADALARLRAK